MSDERPIGYAGIDHVQVAGPPGCEAAARVFYGDALGLPEVPKPAETARRGGCWFQCGDPLGDVTLLQRVGFVMKGGAVVRDDLGGPARE